MGIFMRQVTIIDYGSGNLHSILKAFEHEANPSDFKIVVSSDKSDILNASHIVLPGVGAFADCLNGLKNANSVLDSLLKSVKIDKKPFLGVCVGMQMLAKTGSENGINQGLGLIDADVVAIRPSDKNLKIPHMGWNELNINSEHPIVEGIKSGDHAYFVHSYHMQCNNNENIIATTSYGGDITAIIANENIVATQFHPEKSQAVGLKLINNFLKF